MEYNGFKFSYLVARVVDNSKLYLVGAGLTNNRNDAQKFDSINDAYRAIEKVGDDGCYKVETDKGVPWSSVWDK